MNANISGTQEPGTHNSVFYKLVEFATKAPSGHNTQPWLFKVLNTAIEIHPDFSKALPVVDADHRELYVSLGCAAENLCVAASEFGFKSTVKIKKDKHTYIQIQLKKEQIFKNVLFGEISKRQTNRSIYQNRIVTDEKLSVLQNLPVYEGIHIRYFSNGSHEFEILTEFILQGNTIQMNDSAFKDELLHWIRFNKFQTGKEQNGLTNTVMGIPSVPAFIGKPIVKSFFKPEKQNKTDLAKIHSSSHLALFTIEKNNPESWIQLGRVHERFLLEISHLGISASYLNQPCEVRSVATAMQEKLKLKNEHPVILVRLGYASPMPFSPRRSPEKVIIPN